MCDKAFLQRGYAFASVVVLLHKVHFLFDFNEVRFMAFTGHARLHFPHLIHSISSGFATGSQPIGHTAAHFPHEMQVSSSMERCINAILLNKPYMAPKGQMYLQNGRNIITDSISAMTSIVNFHANRKPRVEAIPLFKRARGKPASSVPAGHISLQKYGGEIPLNEAANSGRSITKTARMMNLTIRKALSPLKVLIFLTKGILWSKS